MTEAGLRLDDFNNQDLRDVADRLLEVTRVEYMDQGVLLITNPPGIEHRKVVRRFTGSVTRAYYTGQTALDWTADQNFQWEFADGSRRFFVPDIVLIHPDARTLEQERASIALIVEVTSPTSRDTVFNDRTVKPVEYAKGGVPYYLLVDQELAQWTLYGRHEGSQRYQIVAEGAYGEDIPLPEPLGFAILTTDWPRWLT